jgi:hypothetical protein
MILLGGVERGWCMCALGDCERMWFVSFGLVRVWLLSREWCVQVGEQWKRLRMAVVLLCDKNMGTCIHG